MEPPNTRPRPDHPSWADKVLPLEAIREALAALLDTRSLLLGLHCASRAESLDDNEHMQLLRHKHVQPGRLLGRIDGTMLSGTSAVTAMASSPCTADSLQQQQLAVGTASGLVSLVNRRTKATTVLRRPKAPDMQGRGIGPLAFLADGTSLLVGCCARIEKWSLEEGRRTWATSVSGKANALCALPDGSFLSGAWYGEIIHWRNEKCCRYFLGHTGDVTDIVFLKAMKKGKKEDMSMEADVASGEARGLIKLWHAASGRCVGTLTGHAPDCVDALVQLEDGSLASAGRGDATVKLWRGQTCVATLKDSRARPSRFLALHALPNGGLAGGRRDGRTVLWDTRGIVLHDKAEKKREEEEEGETGTPSTKSKKERWQRIVREMSRGISDGGYPISALASLSDPDGRGVVLYMASKDGSVKVVV